MAHSKMVALSIQAEIFFKPSISFLFTSRPSVHSKPMLTETASFLNYFSEWFTLSKRIWVSNNKCGFDNVPFRVDGEFEAKVRLNSEFISRWFIRLKYNFGLWGALAPTTAKATATITKTTLQVRHAFLYISLPLLYDYDEKLPKFHVLCRTWTQDHDVLILFLNLDSPSEFNSGKNCQHLMNWTRWNKPDKVWNSANSRLSDVLVSVAVVVA